MSSINFTTMPIADLLTYRNALEAAIIAKCGGSAAGPVAVAEVKGKKGKDGKEKKPSARAGKPTAYGDFSSKIQKEFAEQIKEFKEANPEMKGAHMTWVGNYKEQHPEIYETFKAEWAVAHPKSDAASASASDAGSADEATGEATGDATAVAEAKPKKVLSPEHLAKMKAGREAKKAAKDAEKALAEAEGRAEAPIAVQPKAEKAEKAKKEPKKAKKAAEITVPLAALPSAAPAPAPAPAEEEGDKEAEELPFKLGGATYIRMGVSKPDGNHEWLSGDLWLNKKGKRGAYAGEMMEDGSINTDAEEPELS